MGIKGIADLRQKLFPDGKISTTRLSLEPLQAADAFQLVLLSNDPLGASGLSLLPQPFNMGDAQKLIRMSRDGKGCFAAIRVTETGVFIGCAGALVRSATDIELGYWLGLPYHGKRYGTEAAEAMLAALRQAFPEHRIVAECAREHSASWKLLRRLGFVDSGAKGMRKDAILLTFKASETAAGAAQSA
jgi:RimJ/RimL family protein N-acetyltransferase